jgi:hypothetical protein
MAAVPVRSWSWRHDQGSRRTLRRDRLTRLAWQGAEILQRIAADEPLVPPVSVQNRWARKQWLAGQLQVCRLY